jgi:hypothetical protein
VTWLAAGQHAPALDLQAASRSVDLLDCIVSGLPSRGQLDTEKTGGFVLGNFTRDPERFARERSIFLRELLCFAQDFYDALLASWRFCAN